MIEACSRDPLAQARLNRSAKGAGAGHSPRYPKCGTTQSDRLLDQHPYPKGGPAQLQPQECHPQKRKSPGQAVVGAATAAAPGSARHDAGTILREMESAIR